MDIVVGFDGSGAATKALNLAKTHAKAFGAKIHLVTSLKGGPGEYQEEIAKDFVQTQKYIQLKKGHITYQEDTDQANSNLEAAKKFVEEDGIPCEKHLLIRGLDPGEDIVQFAEEKEPDAIFIGVLKTSKVAKFLLGSNAQYVILHAPCPVVTVK